MPNPPSDRKLHPVSFLFELASHMRQLLLPGIFVLIAGARGSETWQLYAMVLFLPFALASVARALVFRYSLEADELSIRSGLIFKQERHIPYPRIQNIDAIQTIFHRALRVVEVRLETAGGEEPEAHLKVVSLAAFEEVRSRVAAARAQLAPRADRAMIDQAEGSHAPTGEQETHAHRPHEPIPADLLQLSARDLVICGLIQGRGLLVIGALFGLVWEAGLIDRITGSIFGEALEGRGITRQLLRALVGQGIPPLENLVMTMAAFAGLLVVTRLFSVGWALVRLHGFRLRKAGDDVRIDFGLLTRVAAAIPLRRIQSVTVHEGPLHRLFRRVSVHVDTAGGESDQSVQLQRQWLAPVIRRDDAAALLREILPAIAGDVVDWQPVDPRGVRRARIEWLAVAAVISLTLAILLRWWTPVVFAALMLVGEVNARKSVNALGWSVTGNGVFFRSGWLWRRQTVAPHSKIQVVSVQESPFDRHHRMARVTADTAGTSQGRHRIDVPYLSRSSADAVAAQLARQAGRTAFRW